MEFCKCLLYLCCIKKPKYEDEEEYEPQTINSKDYEQPSFLKESISSVYKMVSSFSVSPSMSSLPKKEEGRRRTVTLRDFDDFENLVDRHI